MVSVGHQKRTDFRGLILIIKNTLLPIRNHFPNLKIKNIIYYRSKFMTVKLFYFNFQLYKQLPNFNSALYLLYKEKKRK